VTVVVTASFTKENKMSEFEEKYAGLSVKDLALAMRQLRDDHTIAKSEAAALWSEHEYLAKKALPDTMGEQGISSIVLDGIGRVELRPDASCSIPKENKEDVYEWMKDNGYEDLIVGTINAGTFKAQVKKFIKDGEDFPFDLINFNPYENAVLVRAK
jgi:hypothetical protein